MPLVKKSRAIITSIKNPVEGLYTIKMLPEKKINFYPGQFLHLAIDEYNGGFWPESRCFSMQNAPEDDEIKITFAVKGKYTFRLAKELKVGSYVWIKLPYGEFFMREHNKKNCVFIAGGTGVTPFISLFRSSFFNEYENARVYIGFKNKEFNIYHDDWHFIFNKKLPTQEFHFFYEIQTGKLNIEEIFNHNKNASAFFISGPPEMIKIFKDFLKNKIFEHKIITDEWE